MKRLATAFLVLAMALGVYAQPLLVGHRGSGFGLENSEESFRKGIELGYHYLETDVKLTKDLKFVCTHDDNTTRLGGTLDIATSTLAELQAEELHQRRNGVDYTGRLCSMQEYLQICKEGGVGAVVELKWTAGVNSNDQSNIPLLIQEIEQAGMRDKVIILTSMKPCLEYIRKNYPDITLQFLTGEYWANHFDWCVKHGIDVDIQAGYFDKAAVTRYHTKGLKVNMWTTNSEDGYISYGNMGCDFITTDRLDGHNLPELDPASTRELNYVDYPVTDYTPLVRGHYTLEAPEAWNPQEVASLSKIHFAVFANTGIWYLLGEDARSQRSILAANPATQTVGTVSVPAGFVPEAIAVSADGRLLACNKANAGEAWTLYMWETPEATAEKLLEQNAAGLTGLSLAATGRSDAMKVYVLGMAGEKVAVHGLEVKSGAVVKDVAATTDAFELNEDYPVGMTVSPFSRDNIIFDNQVIEPGVELTFPWASTDGEMRPYATVARLAGPSAGISFGRYGSKLYAVCPYTSAESRKVWFELADVGANTGDMYAVTNTLNPGVTVTTVVPCLASGFQAGATAADGATMYGFFQSIGFIQVSFGVPAAAQQPVDLGLIIERQWIFSNTTDNHPGNIDGNNAQQGTACRGKFYVNNCEEKLIHIFDNSGHLGSIPGGAGWGCARDDAGNIVVRDDKNTNGKHSFMVYPADVLPGTTAEAVRFEVEVPMVGQTNFINASGNLLSQEGGHIYLFPNKCNRVNIITVASGAVARVHASEELNYNGSTAGYVCPIANDTENWLYTVRSQGIHGYSGGSNHNVLTSRATTTAPGRNGTGGCALIVEGGNRVLLHNSGSNYMGGFSVRDLTMDKVYCSVDPIGTLGYVDGGNRSTFNWLTVERNGYADYTVYLYCPSNGIACYRLYSPELSGVEAPATEVSEKLTVLRNGTLLTAPGCNGLSLFAADGRLVAETAGDSVDTAGLPAGVYVLRSGKAVCKVAI